MEPLQVLERRSAVSRQACHAVSVLAEACGDRMEPLAVQLLPVLLKAVAMGIQVCMFVGVAW
jgi:CLIP-associating protein 1/2